MARNLAILLLFVAVSWAEDDKKWVWGDGGRNSKGVSRDVDSRYSVFEDEEPIRPSYTNQDYFDRPNYRPLGPGNRPYRPSYQRPGGVYDVRPPTHHNNYAEGHLNTYPQTIGHHDRDILTGPVPSWVREGPYKDFDRCKCTEKFNCPSPGISYGHCDVGKQYCCYSTKKHNQLGGPPPSRPVHSAENGILVGPDGPYDVPHRRPAHHRPVTANGDYRPGHQGGGAGGFGVSGGPIGGRPVYSPENGILVGPGGPYDRPNRGGGGFGLGGGGGGTGSGISGYGGYGRSSKNN